MEQVNEEDGNFLISLENAWSYTNSGSQPEIKDITSESWPSLLFLGQIQVAHVQRSLQENYAFLNVL